LVSLDNQLRPRNIADIPMLARITADTMTIVQRISGASPDREKSVFMVFVRAVTA
jgi:hypothetical protein